jgi:biotin-(acetyl-CoA carboxylase) ligase
MAEASALPAGFRREAFESLPSTNSAAFASARDGAATGLWVTAASAQTAGRGRRAPGRAEPATSLHRFCSSTRHHRKRCHVSFVAGIALHQAVIDLAGPSRRTGSS